MHVALLVTEIPRQDQNFRIIPRILCTMNLAIVLYGWAHPHYISNFIYCHEDTSVDHLTRVCIKKNTELPNAAAVLK